MATRQNSSPSPRPRVPKYSLHKGSGQAVVYLAGKAVYLGRWGTAASRSRYKRAVAEFLARPEAVEPRPGLTVTELAVAYMRHVARYYVKDGRPTTQVGIVRLAIRGLRALYGPTPAAEFGPLALKAVREHFIAAGLARSTINGHVARIRQAFRWAAENEILPAGVFQALTTVAGLRAGRSSAPEPRPVRPVAAADVDAVEPHVAAAVWAMIRLQWLTGMRSGEVVIMRRRDLDMAGRVWLYRPASHKTEHHGLERAVELGPQAVGVLRGFLQADGEAFLFSPPTGPGARGGMHYRAKRPGGQSGRRLGRRYTPDSYRRAIARACRAAGVSTWHPHQIRHAFATRVRRLYGLEVARILCGHRSAVVTEIYAEADRARARQVAAKIG